MAYIAHELVSASAKFLADEASFRTTAAISEFASNARAMVYLSDIFRLALMTRLFDYSGALRWLSWCHKTAIEHNLPWNAHLELTYLHSVYDLDIEDLDCEETVDA